MIAPLDFALAAAAFVGHFSIAVWLFNRLHALALPRRLIKVLEKLIVLAAALLVALFVIRWIATGQGVLAGGHGVSVVYLALCWLAAIAMIPGWLVPKFCERSPAALVTNDTTFVNVAEQLGFVPLQGGETRLMSRLPGNQILNVAIQQKTLQINRLPRELDGLTIAHLSDLHMTGQFTREFYDVIVDQTNDLNADVVVITGDILEKTSCLPWILPTLGRLQARRAKYFILGNHETRLPDVAPLRAALVEAGLTDIGSRCERIAVRGTEVLVAGTELPWFGEMPNVPDSRLPTPDCPSAHPFRILLSHTPDQLPWAKAHDFDLMLAGHNHGGQIRLPYLGALIVPSRYGFRYAGGLYFEPPTLLHVSRGVAGTHPIRLNCPPEIALLVLRTV